MLCNPEQRRRYDKHGSEGLDINFMDAGEFFTALFGSQKFDHLVRLQFLEKRKRGQSRVHRCILHTVNQQSLGTSSALLSWLNVLKVRFTQCYRLAALPSRVVCTPKYTIILAVNYAHGAHLIHRLSQLGRKVGGRAWGVAEL